LSVSARKDRQGTAFFVDEMSLESEKISPRSPSHSRGSFEALTDEASMTAADMIEMALIMMIKWKCNREQTQRENGWGGSSSK
jgi:hypothetical protein